MAPPPPPADTVRDIKDPEHPYSLEQLSVLSEESVSVDEKLGRIQYARTPVPFWRRVWSELVINPCDLGMKSWGLGEGFGA